MIGSREFAGLVEARGQAGYCCTSQELRHAAPTER